MRVRFEMNVDKTSLKRLVEQSKPNEMLVLQVNPLEKNSLQSCQKEIETKGITRVLNEMEDK